MWVADRESDRLARPLQGFKALAAGNDSLPGNILLPVLTAQTSCCQTLAEQRERKEW